MPNAARRSLQDHVAVVTGATSGIGRAIALGLAAEGARLVLLSREQSRLTGLADTWPTGATRPVLVVADLLEEQDVARAGRVVMAEFGDVHLLVHSAGAMALGPFGDLSVSGLDEQYRVNVRAPFQLTQALLPGIIRARGQIVFVNSSAGLMARAARQPVRRNETRPEGARR